MRNITSIVIHHSVSPKDQEILKSIKSFNNNHAMRMAGQEPSGTEWPNIAYHYCIHYNGQIIQTRELDKIGWHASNWPINQTSIGICLIGSFDSDTISVEMNNALIKLIQKLRDQYPTITNVFPHRKFAKKSCPGKNISDAYIDTLNASMRIEEGSKWFPSYEQQLQQANNALARAIGLRKTLLLAKIKRLIKRING